MANGGHMGEWRTSFQSTIANPPKFETIKRMQAYYRSVLGQDAPASPEERQALRRAMIDYGALQPSPVQKATETARALDTSIVASSLSPTQHNTDVRHFLNSLSHTTNKRA